MKRLSDELSRCGVAMCCALMMFLGLSFPALAQESVESGGEEGVGASDPLYWAKLRGIRTMQKREVQKVGRLGATLYGGLIPNNIFERYYPVGVRLNYYILEGIGIEFAGSYAFGVDTGLQKTLEDKQGVAAKAVLLGDRQISHLNFGINWSPFFGKTSLLNRSLNYFDVYLFGGFGAVVKQTEENIRDLNVTAVPEGVIGGGIMYFFSNDVVLRLDVRQFIFAKASGGVANPTELSLGLMYMF